MPHSDSEKRLGISVVWTVVCGCRSGVVSLSVGAPVIIAAAPLGCTRPNKVRVRDGPTFRSPGQQQISQLGMLELSDPRTLTCDQRGGLEAGLERRAGAGMERRAGTGVERRAGKGVDRRASTGVERR